MQDEGVIYTLGDAIREERQRQGMTQKDFAQKAGVMYQTIGSVENGRTQNPTTLGMICQALGTDMRTMLSRVTVIAIAEGRSFAPDVGRLTRRLMEHTAMTLDELAAKLGKPPAEVEMMLLNGNCGSHWWGAAAMAFQVPLVAYEIAVSDGYEMALRFLGIDDQPDDPARQRRRRA